MSKQKTKSSAKKRFKVTGTGKIKRKHFLLAFSFGYMILKKIYIKEGKIPAVCSIKIAINLSRLPKGAL